MPAAGSSRVRCRELPSLRFFLKPDLCAAIADERPEGFRGGAGIIFAPGLFFKRLFKNGKQLFDRAEVRIVLSLRKGGLDQVIAWNIERIDPLHPFCNVFDRPGLFLQPVLPVSEPAKDRLFIVKQLQQLLPVSP